MEFPLDKKMKGDYLFKMKCYAILIITIALGASSCVANQSMTKSSEDELRLEIKALKASMEASNAKLVSLENEKRDVREQKIQLMLLKKELNKNIEAVKILSKSAYEIKEPAGLKIVRLQGGGETGGADGVEESSPTAKKATATQKSRLVEKAAGDGAVKDKPSRIVLKKHSAVANNKKTPSKAQSDMLKSLKTLSTEELYDKGLRLYNTENYSGARMAFKLLIAKSPEHNLADNALYWVAETYYAHTQYTKAIEIFNDVAKRYPDSNKTPDSILKGRLLISGA